MPSSTVEDYLKQIFLEQQQLGDQLVPNGRLATALGVTPSTATIMVKTLAESGLVEYEPRGGTRLTDKGQRLALHVLRRHRLVELFLVKVLELDWSEVREEADVLEHAISEKVLERIDVLLGHPTMDPHGDPIPNARGEIVNLELHSLAECEPGDRVRIASVEDSDPEFLRFADAKGLRPGTKLTVEDRDTMADSVTVHPGGGKSLVIGSAAAERILVTTQ